MVVVSLAIVVVMMRMLLIVVVVMMVPVLLVIMVVMTVLMDVVRGRYLSFVPQDLHTIGAFLRRRWGSMPAFSPEKEEEEAPAAPQEESADG